MPESGGLRRADGGGSSAPSAPTMPSYLQWLFTPLAASSPRAPHGLFHRHVPTCEVGVPCGRSPQVLQAFILA